jgi:hypothetical protein
MLHKVILFDSTYLLRENKSRKDANFGFEGAFYYSPVWKIRQTEEQCLKMSV